MMLNGYICLFFLFCCSNINLSLLSTALVTNTRSRTLLTRPPWPLMTWASKMILQTTSALEPMNLAQALTRSTCVSAVAWLLFGPSLVLWPRSSSWWPSSSSMRRGESLMRSMTVCMTCCLYHYILSTLGLYSGPNHHCVIKWFFSCSFQRGFYKAQARQSWVTD